MIEDLRQRRQNAKLWELKEAKERVANNQKEIKEEQER